MWQCRVESPEKMQKLGESLGRVLEPGHVVCLSGDLGAGKTILAQGLARGMGFQGYVTSPTFTLVHEYQGDCPVYHLDVYRLDNPVEFMELGFQDYFNEIGIAIVEWPERILEFLPDSYLLISINRDVESDDHRWVTIKSVGTGYERVLEELKQDASFGH